MASWTPESRRQWTPRHGGRERFGMSAVLILGRPLVRAHTKVLSLVIPLALTALPTLRPLGQACLSLG